jgi:hypothetical protein
MKYRLQCNFCSETFVHIGSSFPSHCPLCFAYVGLDGKPEVNLPFLSKAANKTPDALNRQMEEGARNRQYLASEMTGNPVSDFDSMKHTNMRDGLKAGDTSYVPTRQPKTDDLAATFGNGQGGQVDPAILQGVRTGGNPNFGSKQIPSVNNWHRQNAHRVVSRGTQAKY